MIRVLFSASDMHVFLLS